MSSDVAAGLWPYINQVMESPFTDAVLKQRLRVSLAAMTYWCRMNAMYQCEDEEHRLNIEDLINDLKSPTHYESVNSVVEQSATTVVDMGISTVDEEVKNSPASAASRNDLPSAVLSALLLNQRGTKEQATAWQSLVDILIADMPDLGNKKRKLQTMNPLKSNKKKTVSSSSNLVIPDSVTAVNSYFMGTKFHPAPAIASVFTVERMKVLQLVFSDKIVKIPKNSVDFNALVEDLRVRLQAGPAIMYVVDRRRNHSRKSKPHARTGATSDRDKADSVKAVYSPSASASVQESDAYKSALQVLAILEGRLKHYIEKGGIRAEAAKLDKSGLSTTVITAADLAADLPTALFVVLATLEFSSRKAFTLEAQQQGGLNPALQYMLRDLEKEEHKHLVSWPLVFHVYPNESTVARLTTPQKVQILDQWMQYMPLLARFLKEQWKRGVDKSATRLMLVPRRLKQENNKGNNGVDSDGWNRVSGAWNNALRFIRLLMNDSHPMSGRVLFKVLKLTAGDQMQWAEMDGGKGVDMDTEVFRSLVAPGFVDKKGNSKDVVVEDNTDMVTAGESQSADISPQLKIAECVITVAECDTETQSTSVATSSSVQDAWFPWDGLLDSGKSIDQMHHLTTRIHQLCDLHSVPIHKWLGYAKARTEDSVKIHLPMICGVAVGPLSSATAQALKEMGFAGSKP
jgi:hypothetical protein